MVDWSQSYHSAGGSAYAAIEIKRTSRARQLNYKPGWPPIKRGITVDFVLKTPSDSESIYTVFMSSLKSLFGGDTNKITDCSGGFNPFGFIFELSEKIQNSELHENFIKALSDQSKDIENIYTEYNTQINNLLNLYIDLSIYYSKIYFISESNKLNLLKPFGSSDLNEEMFKSTGKKFRIEWETGLISITEINDIINNFITKAGYNKLFTVDVGPNLCTDNSFINWLNVDSEEGFETKTFPFMFCLTQHNFNYFIEEVHVHSTDETICLTSPWLYNVNVVGLYGKVMPRNSFIDITLDDGSELCLSNDSMNKGKLGTLLFSNAGGENYVTYNTFVSPRKKLINENCQDQGKSHSCPFIELNSKSGLAYLYMSLQRIVSLRGFMAEPKFSESAGFKQIIFSSDIDNILNPFFSYEDLTYSLLYNIFEIFNENDLAKNSIKNFKFEEIKYGDYAFASGYLVDYEKLMDSEEPSIDALINQIENNKTSKQQFGFTKEDILNLKNIINQENTKSDKYAITKFHKLFGKKPANRFNKIKDKVLLIPHNTTQVYNFFLSNLKNNISIIGSIGRGMFAGNRWFFKNDNGYILIKNKIIDIDYLFYCSTLSSNLPALKFKVNNELIDAKAKNARYTFCKCNKYSLDYLADFNHNEESSIYGFCLLNSFGVKAGSNAVINNLISLTPNKLATDNTMAFSLISSNNCISVTMGNEAVYPEKIQYLTGTWNGSVIGEVELLRLTGLKDISLTFYDTMYSAYFSSSIKNINKKTLKGIPINITGFNPNEYKNRGNYYDGYFPYTKRKLKCFYGVIYNLITSILNDYDIPQGILLSLFSAPTSGKEILCFNKSIYTGDNDFPLTETDSFILSAINSYNTRRPVFTKLEDVINP